jgi:hypothetical protein
VSAAGWGRSLAAGRRPAVARSLSNNCLGPWERSTAAGAVEEGETSSLQPQPTSDVQDAEVALMPAGGLEGASDALQTAQRGPWVAPV